MTLERRFEGVFKLMFVDVVKVFDFFLLKVVVKKRIFMDSIWTWRIFSHMFRFEVN